MDKRNLIILKATFQVEVRYKVPMELSNLCGSALEKLMDDGEIEFDKGDFVYKGKRYQAHYDDISTCIRDNNPVEMVMDEHIDMLDDGDDEKTDDDDDE